MICIWCQQPLNMEAPSDYFRRYSCRNCQDSHYTSYIQLYETETDAFLAEYIRVDEFFISIVHVDERASTHIYKANSLGTGTADTLIFTVARIMDLPFHDISALKRKLQTYAIFS